MVKCISSCPVVSSLFKRPATVKCGSQTINVGLMTKEQKNQFNQLSERLGEQINKSTIYSTYNIFLTPQERIKAQNDADSNFMNEFLKGTSDILTMDKAFRIGTSMLSAIKEVFKPLEECMSDVATQEYVKRAKIISAIQLELAEYEDRCVKYQKNLCCIKKKYDESNDAKSREYFAYKYNFEIDKYNTVVNKYNKALSKRLAPLVKEQLALREQIRKDFSDNKLFNMIYGKPPKMPTGINN